jgi:hypothetical protein
MDKYTGVGVKYAGEIAALREQMSQLRQQVMEYWAEQTAASHGVAHLNQIIDGLRKRRLETDTFG